MSAHVRPDHLWIVGDTRRDRAAALQQVPAADFAVDCHRGARGPYTGVGSLLRALIPLVKEADAELVAGYVAAILCAAPELEPLIGSAPETLTALAPHDERTRWYSFQRTQRISNNLVELLLAYCRTRPGGLTLAFDTVHEADHTDREFLATALRRADPAVLRLIVGSTAAPSPDDAQDGLAPLLSERAQRIEAPAVDQPSMWDQAGGLDLARAYVAEDGTGDDEATRAAYEALTEEERTRLHNERGDALEAGGEYSIRLGALLYQRLNGWDPLSRAWPLYAQAEGYCMSMGYYHGVLECLDRLEELAVRAGTQYNKNFVQHAGLRRGQIFGLMGYPERSEASYLATLAQTRVPRQAMSLQYALGMLYTRWKDSSRRDHNLATTHLNTAVALATQLEEPADRSFYTAFMSNGLALAVMHAGNPAEALELVEGALSLLDRELVVDKHLLHRSVLRHNRSQLLAVLGRRDEALTDLNEVIELDPYYPEYHFDRGNLRFQAGDGPGALADYDHAETLGPPFPELFHNRAEVLASLGDLDGAGRNLTRALELDPANLESAISLASLLLDADPEHQAGAAAGIVRRSLAANPAQPRLLSLLGRALAETGDAPGAAAALDEALRLDPALHQALVSRAILAFNTGDYAQALADLDRAVELAGDDPDLLYNRGSVHEVLGDPEAAIRDYQRALTLPDCDAELLNERREACQNAPALRAS